jgi:release factor glutamine methyltransferase
MTSEATSHDDLVAALRAAGCVFAEEEATLLREAATSPGHLARLRDRRVAGEPLEHVVGWAEFCGLRIEVGPGVFVPRPRTELLVETAAALTREGAVVLDLCCGSGALGRALAESVHRIELYAADLDPAAVSFARRNLADLPGAEVFAGDLFAPLPPDLRGRVDVLLCNVPYVPSGSIALMPTEARDHEPRLSLDGGADGLDVLRRVLADAASWLAPGGHLFVETSEAQARTAVDLMTAAGLRPHVVRSDELDATVVVARSLTSPRPPAPPSRR